jgi:hypothetical protein
MATPNPDDPLYGVTASSGPTTVDSLVRDARNYTWNLLNRSSQELGYAMQAVNEISPGGVYNPPLALIEPPHVGDPGTVPAYSGIRYTFDKFTTPTPVLSPVGELDLPPDPGVVPPIAAFNPPSKPVGSADDGLLGGVPSIDDMPIIPPAPDLLEEIRGIPVPTLVDVVIPPIPAYRAPEFTGSHPVFDAEMPTDLDVTMRTQYETISPIMRDAVTSQIDAFIDREFPSYRTGLAKIEDRLNTYLDGGSALSPEIENAIYNRTLDKTDREGRRAIDTAWKDAAKAGYTMPTAYLLAKKQDIDQMRRDNNARAAIDIAVKQAELEQQNLQFAVTQSSNLRKMAIDSALGYYMGLIQINGQALDYARSVVDAIVKSFDIAARYAEVQVRIYEADGRIYEAKLRGAMAEIEAYTAHIRGLEAQVNVNVAEVNAYKARVDAVQAEANVYVAMVSAVRAQVDIEKAKVDVYGARVQAYVAQVNGYTAQWQGYSAAVNGESSKIQASAEQVRAFSAQVQAYEAIVRSRGAAIEARAKTNEQTIRAYAAEVDAYSAVTNAKAVAQSAEIKTYDSTLEAFKAKASVIAERSRSEIHAYEVALRGLIDEAQLQFQYLQEFDHMRVARANGIASIAKDFGGIWGGAAQASLAGMNTLLAQTLQE